MAKKAAALANLELGALRAEIADAIVAACDKIIAGAGHEFFVVDMLQGGAGTSTNMNANEVIANMALRHMGKKPGDYAVVSPTDHVNLSQSTNDVYPTAVRLTMLRNCPSLVESQTLLKAAFMQKATAFDHIIKVGRTQLMDAVPMRLGSEFRAFAVTVGEDIDRLREFSNLLREVNLGGTAIGTGINTPENYPATVIKHLSKVSGIQLITAGDLIEATSDMGAFVTFSGVLKRIAVKLSKICNDLRLLNSGPRAGFGEIRLPSVQAGSSIMPGKVNPVVPEVVNQIAYQVIGNDLTVTLAAEAGQLQLNAMEPVIVFNILQSMRMLMRGMVVLRERCVQLTTCLASGSNGIYKPGDFADFPVHQFCVTPGFDVEAQEGFGVRTPQVEAPGVKFHVQPIGKINAWCTVAVVAQYAFNHPLHICHLKIDFITAGEKGFARRNQLVQLFA
jgi:aspartate ammonia-lyase